MLTSKSFDKIALGVILAAILLTALFINGETLGLTKSTASPGYEIRLFDESRVHHIDIQVDDWDAFLADAREEEYVVAALEIDGEDFERVGLRVKGNNSKNLVEKYGGNRYSLKIEMDQYVDGNTYYGLDKFSLDSSFQDNSYLKTWLAYDMMEFMGVPTPLISWTWVTVNGEDWGLYLAIEEMEESFARRNFGMNYGQLYKPDYRDVDDENADIALRYIGEDLTAYDNIWRNAKFDPTDEEKRRVVDAIKVLDEIADISSGSSADGNPMTESKAEDLMRELESCWNVDEILRYLTVQVFVVNLDSYLGPTGHNYFLHEEEGRLQILPWDYNLAFSTYSLGMPDPVNDAELYVNYPIDTPAWGEVMTKRPLFHHLMMQDKYYNQYHEYFGQFIRGYFEGGLFEKRVAEGAKLIDFYVEKDPTAFCSYEDYRLAVDTITEFCRLRAESVGLQLEGLIPSTIRGQAQPGGKDRFVDASSVWLPDMGEVADLKD